MDIDSLLDGEGRLITVGLSPRDDGDVDLLWDGDVLASFPIAALLHILRRYGRPLDMPSSGPELSLGAATLRLWKYRAPVDLEAKNYLVLEQEGQETLAVLSRQIATVLHHLATRDAARN